MKPFIGISYNWTPSATRQSVWERTVAAARKCYPGAKIILHHDKDAAREALALADVLVQWDTETAASRLFWRMTCVGDPDLDAVLLRDTDAPPNQREADAVVAWLKSDFKLRTMFDQPSKSLVRVPGGLWGSKRGAFPYDFSRLVRWWIWQKKPAGPGAERQFLDRYVYPYAVRGGLNHRCSGRNGFTDNFHINARPFPGGATPETGHVGGRTS